MFASLPNSKGGSDHAVVSQVLPLAMSAMDGYSVCIFAYGQTGSGKTHTLNTLQTALTRQLFKPREGFRTTITMKYVEIYNDQVRDLLRNPAATSPPTWNSGTFQTPTVPIANGAPQSLSVIVTAPEEVADLLRRGAALRSTFSTDLNSRSSRSHEIGRASCRERV